MPAQKRHKTNYPGVYYIIGKQSGTNGKKEKIYYISYRKNGRVIDEKAGRQFKDDMTPARASKIRALKASGKRPTNRESRERIKFEAEAQANRWTIERLWDEYKKLTNIKGISTDNNRFTNHLAQPFGKKEPKELVPLDIDRLRVKLLKTKKPSTVKNILELLRRVINFGVKRNLCPPLTFTIKMPPVNNEKTEDLSPEQLTSLMEVLNTDENRLACNLMKMVLFTGMRRGELFNLKWDDVDFKRSFVHIRDPKGGADQIIPLNSESSKILHSNKRSNSDYVFPGRNGKKRTDIKKVVNRIKAKAGIPKEFRALHGLRHVYASMLVSSGKVDMYTLQKLLTHKSPAMTQRYAHLRDETLKNASNVANDIIMQATKKKKAKVVGIKK
jgi:integrase